MPLSPDDPLAGLAEPVDHDPFNVGPPPIQMGGPSLRDFWSGMQQGIQQFKKVFLGGPEWNMRWTRPEDDEFVRRGLQQFGKHFTEGLPQAAPAALEGFQSAWRGSYKPDNAVGIDDQNRWTDKDGNPIGNIVRRPDVLPATRAEGVTEAMPLSPEQGQGWFGSNVEGAMPSFLDVVNTMGNPFAAAKGVTLGAGATRMAKQAVKPLDQADAARLQRAAEQGYTVPAFHATDKTFDTFKRKEGELGMHFGTAGQAEDRMAYLTSGPRGERGARNTEGAQTYPVLLKLQRPLRLRDVGRWSAENLTHELEKAGIRKDLIWDAMREGRTEAGKTRAIKDLIQREGYDGIVYRNTGEVEGAQPLQAAQDAAWEVLKEAQRRRGKPMGVFDAEDMQTIEYQKYDQAYQAQRQFREANAQDSFIVFNPNQVRSRFAEFDPDKGKSGMLLSAEASKGTGAGGLGEAMRRKPPTFYSAVERAVENIPAQSARAEQWLGERTERKYTQKDKKTGKEIDATEVSYGGLLGNQPGVKPEELEWLGIPEFLAGKKGQKVTREEIAEYVRQNKVEIEEVQRASSDSYSTLEAEATRLKKQWTEEPPIFRAVPDKINKGVHYIEDQHGNRVGYANADDPKYVQSTVDDYQKTVDDPSGVSGNVYEVAAAEILRNKPSTKFSGYATPGAENYRELVLTLPPDPKLKGLNTRLEAMNKEIGDITERQNTILRDLGTDRAPRSQADAVTKEHKEITERRIALQAERGKLIREIDPLREREFTTAHWDERNPLAHVRHSDKMMGSHVRHPSGIDIPSGDQVKSLHLEEVQSDWHQQGRAKGYSKPYKRSELKEAEADPTRTEFDREHFWFIESPDNMFQIPKANHASLEAAMEYVADTKRAGGGVPDAPFKATPTWAGLVLKRMIRHAAENGYKRISWDPGTVHAERYDLSKHVQEITVRPYYAKNVADKLGTALPKNAYRITAHGKARGDTVIDKQFSTSEELAEIIGKETAEKIFSGKNLERLDSGHEAVLRDADLKVGGEEMGEFYDKILVNTANKLVKKYGAEVKKGEFEGDRGGVSGKMVGDWKGIPEKENADWWRNLTDGMRDRYIEEYRDAHGSNSHYFDITPELAAVALGKGFPLFARSNETGRLASGTAELQRRVARAQKLADEVPGLKAVLKHLTPEETAKVTRRTADRLSELFTTLPSAEEMASVAYSGRAKKGWYQNSAKAITEVFGAEDAPRFSALLAALSPQTAVEPNMVNAIRTWTAWVNAGRPLDRDAIITAMGEGVQGARGAESVMNAWINNTVRALTDPDPAKTVLSGPKVNSFMQNLRGAVDDVTLDTWMATYAGLHKDFFKASGTKPGGTAGKGSSYMAMSAAVRKAADILTERTGTKWTPAEIQETVWSWAKTLYEKAGSAEGANSLRELLRAGDLTPEDIAKTPDFELLFVNNVYRKLFEEGGYGAGIENVERSLEGRRGADAGDAGRGDPLSAEGAGIAEPAFRAHLESAAERIDAVRSGRDAGASGEGGTTSLAEAQSAAARAAGSRQPLQGLPTRELIINDEYFVPGPMEIVHKAAENYMKGAGLPYQPLRTYKPVDEARAKRIAQAFDEMPHDPSSPEVQASYDALIGETIDQFQEIKKTGLKIEFIKQGQADPYEASPRLAAKDMSENNHLWVFPTDGGFGTGPEAAAALLDNPMLRMTDEVVDGRRLMANDVFRIVHDYFGHFKDGVGFRAAGEENAWRSHSAMYSDAARPAMTSETRGQNSWLNYGPHGSKNRTAKSAETVYAPQKIGMLPEWVINEGRLDARAGAGGLSGLSSMDGADEPMYEPIDFDPFQLEPIEGDPFAAVQ